MKEVVEFYKREYRDSLIYKILAESEKNEKIREILLNMHAIESSHANFWLDFLKRKDVEVKRVGEGLLSKIISVIGRISPSIVFSILELNEIGAVLSYYEFFKSHDLDEDEKERIRKIIIEELEHEKFFTGKKELLKTENIRDLVLGINDSIVEILGVVTGLSAVYTSKPVLVGVSGLVVGVAGALSMASGSFISVRSQREANEVKRKLKMIVKELKYDYPEFEDVNENEFRSAAYTGIAYLSGVILPVIPYFLVRSTLNALPLSILLSSLLLVFVGSIISLISGISLRKKVIELLVAGIGTSLLSFLLGKFLSSFLNLPY